MIKPYLLSYLLLLSTALLHAQQTADTLSEVEVNATKMEGASAVQSDFTAGQARQDIAQSYRPFYIGGDLSRMLAQQTSVFVKSYGINSMATLSLRGASAAQSGVFWKGIPLMNPALGVADISLLQAGLFDDVTLQYGGAGALWGSGNVGGALLLGSKPIRFYKKKPMLSLSIGGGSFGARNSLLKTQYQDSAWSIALTGFYQYARNDFEFTNALNEQEPLPHAALNAAGGIISIARNWSKSNAIKHYLALDVWYQRYNRQTPPALFESFSNKESQDRSLRSVLEWHFGKGRNTSYAKVSFNKEWMRYEDPPAVYGTEYATGQYYQELGYQRKWNTGNKGQFGHNLLVFSPLQYVTFRGADTGNSRQFRPAVAAAYRFNFQDFSFNTALRQEWWNGKATPLLPEAGGEYAVWFFNLGNIRKYYGRFLINGSVQRSYRIPSLNELFVFPGGNSKLKPEQGWSREIGYKVELNRSNRAREPHVMDPPLIRHELSYFNRDIKDWIIWLGGSVWSPHNLARVWSRGVETRNAIELPVKNVWLLFSFNTTYVLATNMESYLPADSSIGRQIPYTPRYVFQGNAGVQWKQLLVNYNHTYTGYRFVTMDESQFLPPFQLGNIQATYGFHVCQVSINAVAQIQNLWNAGYQVVWGRPMPHRYYLFSLQFVL